MANPWFRLYSEFATDPKVQRMGESDQRRFIMLLCMRCSNGDVTLHDEDVAFQLRVSNDEWLVTKALFLSKDLIDEDNKPTAWEDRQFISDSSAPRVAKLRAKRKEACNVTVTPPEADTEAEADTEQKQPKTRAPRFDAQAHLVSLGVDPGVSADWLKLRKTKKADATLTAIAGIVAEANKAGFSLPDALSECCSRGWAGFKADWLSNTRGASFKTPAPDNFATREYVSGAL